MNHKLISTVTVIIYFIITYKCMGQQPTYDDSVKLFLNTQKLRCNLIKQGYVKFPILRDDFLLQEWHVIDAAKHKNIPPKGMEECGRYKVGARKVGNLYQVYDFFFGQINKSLGVQYFSTTIHPYKKETWQNKKTGDGRLVYNYQNAKPVNFGNKAKQVIKCDSPSQKENQYKVMVYYYVNNKLDSINTYYKNGKLK